MPVSWPALHGLWQDVAEQVSDTRQADLILWAHPQDPKEDQGLAALHPVPQALLSEDPFWDTIFGPDPLARRIHGHTRRTYWFVLGKWWQPRHLGRLARGEADPVALAFGARPIAMASPGHRLQDMGGPAQAYRNLWGMDEAAAVEAILNAPWDAAFFAAYAEAQQVMARLWTDAGLIAAELPA